MLFVVLCVVSTVNATDNVTDDVVNVNDETDFVQANNDDQSVSEEPLTTNEEDIISASFGTFADLNNEIENATGELNLTRNYVYSNSDDDFWISIDNEITINGNGFLIDANNAQMVGVGVTSYNVVLKNIVFVNFSGYYLGGAISWAGGNGTLINCSFENCNIDTLTDYSTTSLRGGGAVYWSGDNGKMINCSFENCKVLASKLMRITGAYGGAVYWRGDNGELINCSFENCGCSENFGYSYGGAIYFGYWSEEYSDAMENVINCRFENNFAQNGGAISSRLGSTKIENTIFINNTAEYSAGAIYLINNEVGAFANIKNCEFINNSANVAGAIYENNNGTTVIGCKFINNKATNDAGALYLFRDYEQLSDCTFINNKAGNNGAAILWKGNGGSILSSVFVNNSATKDTGIYINGANNIVKDSALFSNNQNQIIYADGYTVTANSNWWGNTIHNYNQQPNVPAKINVKNWLFMNYTVDTNFLKIGDIATIRCDLTNLVNYNGIVSKYDAIDLPLNLIALPDNNVETSITMICGVCEAKYVATHTPTGNLTVKFNNIEETFYFTIEKAELQLNISDSAILKGNLLVTAPNNATGIVQMVINNKEYSANMTNGSARVSINDLPLGRYLATTSFESDLYVVNTFNSYIDIKSSIDANNLTKTQDSATKFQATFYDFDGNVLKNTKVTFMLNGRLQTSTTDNNGVASLDINFSPNTYEITSLNPATDETKINEITITASGGSSTDNNNTPGENTDNNSTSSGNTNGTNSSGNSNSTSNNPKPITDNQITIPSLDSGSGTIKLPNDAMGTITLDIAGKPYYFTVVNGVCNVKLSELDNGVYGYILIYSGDAKYASFTKTGSIKVDKTPETPVDNKTNTTENTQENTTVVDNSKIAASNVNVLYTAGSYYTIKVYGKDGELADGVNVKISGKISKSLTTSNGVAKFKVTQVPGTYMITISALGKSVSKTITVKKATPKLTAKAKAFKKSVKNKNYVVTLKTNQNKVMKKAKLTLKVNGKTYSATTNAKGQATFKITKLTKKGKFTGTIAYKGNAYYNKLSKKVKITIK